MIEAELSGQCEMRAVAVYASGFAHFRVSNSCGTAPEEVTSGLRKVSSSDLQKLRAEIVRTDFDSLPERIEPDPKVVASEEDLFSIGVWHDGVTKRVNAFGLDRALDKSAAQRFQALWQAILQYGPEKRK